MSWKSVKISSECYALLAGLRTQITEASPHRVVPSLGESIDIAVRSLLDKLRVGGGGEGVGRRGRTKKVRDT